MSTYIMNMKDATGVSEPDLAFVEYIKSWVEKHIRQPIQGFEQKTAPHGGSLTNEELLTQTHFQVIQVACYFRSRKKPLQEIIDIISFFKK